MPSVWHRQDENWHPVAAGGYEAEKTLHDLVEKAPGILPLAAIDRLTVVGREVQLGTGFADLLAVEPGGRLVIIEIKLRSNPEARRAVVAQVLSYAAFLRGLEVGELERSVLGTHLAQRKYSSLLTAVQREDQQGSVDASSFAAGLEDSLRSGWFRLVLVLDEVPADLIRLVGYLESITEHLLIDLITVSRFEIGGEEILIAERIDPDSKAANLSSTVKRTPATGIRLADGGDDFAAFIEGVVGPKRDRLERLYGWAKALEDAGLIRLQTFHGKNGLVLLPRLRDEMVGFGSIYGNEANLQIWTSVFERRATGALEALKNLLPGFVPGQGNWVPRIDDDVLAVFTQAYREATGSVESI